MKYIAKPVEVDAFKIVSIGAPDEAGSLTVEIDGVYQGHDTVHCTQAMLARMKPQLGDYVVIQSDGYVYLNPKDVFERKYRPAQSENEQAFKKSLGVGRIEGSLKKSTAK